MTQNSVRSYRLWINLAKVAGVAAALAAFVFLLKQPLHGSSLLIWACLAILGVTACVAIIDVLLESTYMPRKLIIMFSMVSFALIAMSFMDMHFSGTWEQEAFAKSIAGSLAITFLMVIHLFLSYSDTEMDEDRSRYYHLSGRRQQAKIYLHLAFNVLPYAIGFGGVYFIKMAYGESSAIKFSIALVAVLLAFVIADEAFKRYRSQSFFWRNKPTVLG